MRRATFDQAWQELDAVDDRERHPLHSRLSRPTAQRPMLVTRQTLPPPIPVPTQKPIPTATAAAPAKSVTKTPAPKRSILRRAGSALAFSLLGFITGAIFWHFVGFWDFVGQVMFGARSSGTQLSQAPPPIKLKDKINGVASLTVVIEPEACTTLQIDRETGTTQSVACETQSLPLRSLKIARREDRWVTAGQRIQEATARGWSALKVEMPPRLQDQASAD